MFTTLKALPWLFPFLRELFRRSKRPPTRYRRDGSRQSSIFLITGFFIVLGIVTLFAGEKIITLMAEANSLRQENTTLRYARDTNRELIHQLYTSNEVRGRLIDSMIEQNRILQGEVDRALRTFEKEQVDGRKFQERVDRFIDTYYVCNSLTSVEQRNQCVTNGGKLRSMKVDRNQSASTEGNR